MEFKESLEIMKILQNMHENRKMKHKNNVKTGCRIQLMLLVY